MTDLILWRHGQTDYNSQGRIQGRVDVPLNETGRDQARRAAEDIAALGPTRIVSSPLTRARDTAEALASRTGLSVEIDEGLAEKSFGDWEGLKAADIKKQWPEHYATWRAGGAAGSRTSPGRGTGSTPGRGPASGRAARPGAGRPGGGMAHSGFCRPAFTGSSSALHDLAQVPDRFGLVGRHPLADIIDLVVLGRDEALDNSG